MDLHKLTRLKEQAEDLARRRDRAQGVVDQLTAELKAEFDVTPDDVDELLQRLQTEVATAEQEASQLLTAFQRKFGNHLQSNE